jgi:5'-deoxynucleotidase YfbR-like HD superfamily hydrolase
MNNIPEEILQKMRENQKASKQENRINEIKNSLKNLGFKEEGNYFKLNSDSIKIYDDDTLENVFEKLIRYGSQQKLWEIQRVLQIS